jgi:hypothetical protein
MKPRVLQFRVPSEHRLQALFTDEPAQASEVERLEGQVIERLRGLHRRATARARDFAQGTLMLLNRALADVAAEERGRA